MPPSPVAPAAFGVAGADGPGNVTPPDFGEAAREAGRASPGILRKALALSACRKVEVLASEGCG
ncbi:hypothetical protein [Streptomyces enissocaesilis]|uniref:Uncharacterized protein n=1 Tax=Streptomyces enissocaesilis TaxID=332589 RepID=A0ABN3XG68_9ACTN